MAILFDLILGKLRTEDSSGGSGSSSSYCEESFQFSNADPLSATADTVAPFVIACS